MTREELNALLVEVDMPRAVEEELWDDGIKLRLDFPDRNDSIKIASTYGKLIEVPEKPEKPLDLLYTMKMFAQSARSIVEEQRKAGLVPYYAIPRDPETLQALS